MWAKLKVRATAPKELPYLNELPHSKKKGKPQRLRVHPRQIKPNADACARVLFTLVRNMHPTCIIARPKKSQVDYIFDSTLVLFAKIGNKYCIKYTQQANENAGSECVSSRDTTTPNRTHRWWPRRYFGPYFTSLLPCFLRFLPLHCNAGVQLKKAGSQCEVL